MTFEQALPKIVAALQPRKVILFGSRARGDHRPDSDYDLLLVVDDNAASPWALMAETYKITSGRDFLIDVLVYPQSLFDERLEEQSDVVCYAVEEGVVLYEA
jgi:uncharacterized protein